MRVAYSMLRGVVTGRGRGGGGAPPPPPPRRPTEAQKLAPYRPSVLAFHIFCKNPFTNAPLILKLFHVDFTFVFQHEPGREQERQGRRRAGAGCMVQD